MERKSFKDGFLSDLKARVDFVGIASKYGELTKKSGTYWMRCPFHFEDTPSCSINQELGFFHCFGCGEHGDIIKFVQKLDNLDFMSAIEKLANSVNMEIQYQDGTAGVDFSKELKKKKEILKALDDATNFYCDELYKPTSTIAQNYIKKRKLNKKSLDNFRIGYSPDFNSLIKVFNGKISREIMVESGLAYEGAKGLYDVLAERLVFPIWNQMGQIVGFSGRILTDNKELAKYKNTRATMVFDKSRLVFGLYQATKARAIDRQNFILLVEGQIDVIMLHQHGFENAVATLGTAFTEGHATQLKRINQNVIVCYDGDGAGQKATMKAGDILANAGCNVKIASLPSGMDPDEFIRANGAEKFQELLNNAEELYDYKLRKWAEEMNTSSNFDKTEYIKKAINLISGLETRAQAELYLPLIKNYTNVPVDALRESLYAKYDSKLVTKKPQFKDEQISKNLFVDAYQKADKFILSSLLNHKDYVKDIDISNLEFINPDYQNIYTKIIANSEYKIGDLYDDFEVDENKNLEDLVNSNLFSENDEINKNYFIESVKQNELLKLKKLSEKLELAYSQSQDLTERTNLAKQLMETKLKIKKIGK